MIYPLHLHLHLTPSSTPNLPNLPAPLPSPLSSLLSSLLSPLFSSLFSLLSSSPHSSPLASLFSLHLSSLLSSPLSRYLFSGGEEGVLVIWQLATGIKAFVPRLGDPPPRYTYTYTPPSSRYTIDVLYRRHPLNLPSTHLVDQSPPPPPSRPTI